MHPYDKPSIFTAKHLRQAFGRVKTVAAGLSAGAAMVLFLLLAMPLLPLFAGLVVLAIVVALAAGACTLAFMMCYESFGKALHAYTVSKN